MELIRGMESSDIEQFLPMALDLWPDEEAEQLRPLFLKIMNSTDKKVLVSEVNGMLIGFIYVAIRQDYVEGSDSSPTGYIEGIYVNSGYRKQGLARKLVLSAEEWLKPKGITQIGSDILMDNSASFQFHKQIGFKEAARLIAFIKDIQ